MFFPPAARPGRQPAARPCRARRQRQESAAATALHRAGRNTGIHRRDGRAARFRRRRADTHLQRRPAQCHRSARHRAGRSARTATLLDTLPRALPQRPPHRARPHVLGGTRRRAGACRSHLRRAARDHRRHHRRRNRVRAQYRALPRARSPGLTGLQIPAARPLLPQRARTLPSARTRERHGCLRSPRLLRRSDGHPAVHAQQPAALCGRFRRRRTHRPARQRKRRHRQRCQLPRPPRLADRRTDHRPGPHRGRRRAPARRRDQAVAAFARTAG